MTGRDAQEGQRRTLRAAPALLPVPERMNADPERRRELLLGQACEPPQRSDVATAGELPAQDPIALSSRNRASERLRGELRNLDILIVGGSCSSIAS